MAYRFDRQAWLAESLKHFRALLRMDTSNPPGCEEPAARYIATLLEREGIEYKILEKAPGRTNVVARLRGHGDAGAVLLNGHLDTVPAESEQWKHPPFAAVEAEGCIWARGAIDMKNMVVMSLMTLIALKRSGIALSRDIIFAAVADEEAGCGLGSLYLVEEHPDLVRAEFVLNEVGGQTVHLGGRRFYPIQVAEKGVCWFELVACGEPGHGSLPHNDSAVAKLSAAVARLASTSLPHHCVPEVETFLRTLANHSNFGTGTVLRGLASPSLARFLLSLLQRKDPQNATAFSAMLSNTASPTRLDAGHATNVIPATARATVDGRVLPGMHVQEFLAEVRSIVGDEVKLNVLTQHDGVRSQPNSRLFDGITHTLAQFDPEGIVLPYMNPAFTDSFAYSHLGATCYGFAPVRLGTELNFAKMFHGHNERIPIDGFLWGQCALLHTVADFCCASSPEWLPELVDDWHHVRNVSSN